MAETVTNNTTTNDTVENKEFAIIVDQNEPFNPILESIFMDSTELARKVHEMFQAIYADCYGVTFDLIPGTNICAFSVYFDHTDHSADGLVVATSKNVDDGKTKNSTLRSTRAYTRRLAEGDRYHLTTEGMEGLDDFIMDPTGPIKKIYKSTGYGKQEINWDAIVSEVADSAYNGVPTQLTKVGYIDVNKAASAIFGSKNTIGQKIEYGVSMIRSIPTFSMNGSGSTCYMLKIDRISEPEVNNLCQKLGVAYQPGLNIIRANK